MNQLLDVDQLAEFLNMPRNSVYQLVFHSKRNGFPYIKIGQRLRFRLNEIEKWLLSQAVNNEVVNDND